ncbi:DHA2 family efflux MFS transporter permease subunit [Telmatospirillum sp.]|uniref:DHA2 family efflux MFS transporter permease subunit n=1 Tax=Telmatospirillum sp. TaxID=2079197 RepID=UPI0028424F03|nr:DHA2 family efflux MFS transporter permease subunit [Telmatospirillum sp.]MDR3439061.1 DHA2 family efflux MFS transporter permease subunit [Telmatospirillum sp.]
MSPAAAHAEARASWRPTVNPWLIALVVTLPTFMEVLDTTIVNVALPHIAGTLSASTDDATWTLTSYLVANGIVLSISGWLGTIFGRKRYFLICIGMFTVCSLLCGMATSLPELILFRAAQGFFGGGLQPNQQSILLDTFEPAKRGIAFSITAIATIVAPVLGPTLGGWITDNYSWRWVFLINVPAGILAFLAVTRLVEDPPWAKAHTGTRRIDGIGLALIALGLGCLQLVLDRGEDADWLASPFIRCTAIAAAVGLIGAVWWLRKTDHPVVNIRVLADRNFALGSTMIFGMAMVLYASAVLLPQMAQEQLGYTATWAGLILSPGTILTMILIPVVLRLMKHVQTRFLIAFGFTALSCALLFATTLAPSVDFPTLAWMRTAQTGALAFLFVPISTVAYATLAPHLNGDAAALYTMFRNIGGSVGIALSTALVTEHTQTHMAHLSVHMTPYEQAYTNTLQHHSAALLAQGVAATSQLSTATAYLYRTLQNQAAIMAYIDTFEIAAVLALLLVPLALATRPAKVTGNTPMGH